MFESRKRKKIKKWRTIIQMKTDFSQKNESQKLHLTAEIKNNIKFYIQRNYP